ncbi:MAG: DRTGG domain-containing protein [Bacteroidales bacterium]|jgi:predicted transcriptional regulator
MKVTDIVETLNLKVFSGHEGLGHEISGGYASDLLSDVMGHADAGAVWITIQTHRNVMAIASLRDLAAIIITCGEKPGEDTMTQSNEEAIPVLGTDLSTFEIAGRLHAILS